MKTLDIYMNKQLEGVRPTPSLAAALNPWREPYHKYFPFGKKDLPIESDGKKGKL